MDDARVKPDVENVSNFFIVGCGITKQACSLKIEPGIKPVLFDAVSNLAQQPWSLRMQAHRFAVDEHRDWHAPGPLPGDAPVRTSLHHLLDATLAPSRRPVHFMDGFQRAVTQS